MQGGDMVRSRAAVREAVPSLFGGPIVGCNRLADPVGDGRDQEEGVTAAAPTSPSEPPSIARVVAWW